MATQQRPDLAEGQVRVERRWLPALAVVALILAVTGGARGAGEAIAGPPGPPTGFVGVVTVQPEAGWEQELLQEDGDFHELLLRSGTAGLYVAGLQGYADTSEGLANEYVEAVLDEQLEHLQIGDPEHVSLGPLPAVRFGYLGQTPDGLAVEGVMTGVVSRSGNAVVFDGFAPEGDLAWAAQDIRTMIDGAVVS